MVVALGDRPGLHGFQLIELCQDPVAFDLGRRRVQQQDRLPGLDVFALDDEDRPDNAAFEVLNDLVASRGDD